MSEGFMAKLYGAVLLKAKDILDYLARSTEAPTLNDLSQNLDISKPTILKILNTLEYCGYVSCSELSGNKRYYLGTTFLSYAQKINDSFTIIEQVTPYLKKLCAESGESINLGIPQKDKVLVLKKLDAPSEKGIKLVSQVGGTMNLYSSSMGKAILASYTPRQLSQYLSQVSFDKLTANTLDTPDKLKEDLELTKERGYSLDNSENQDGIYCVGFSLIKNGQLFGAFSISTLRYTMTDKKLKKLVDLGKATQKEIVENL